MGLADLLRRRRSRRLASAMAPWSGDQSAGHVVQFYTGAYPADAIAAFVQEGIDAGEVALVIATPGHVRAIDRRLQGRGRVLYVDADEALARFMVHGRPDRLRFLDTVGDLVQQAAEHGNGVARAFGEMVVLLCDRGEPDAALELEALWNELTARHRVKLLCSYPLDTVEGRNGGHAARLRDAHTHAVAT
jgi:hypothetical protein